MYKILGLVLLITVTMAIAGVVAHDSVANSKRNQALEELLSQKQSRNITQIRNAYKTLGQYRSWIKPNSSNASNPNTCEKLSLLLENQAANENWSSWNLTWSEFTKSGCF